MHRYLLLKVNKRLEAQKKTQTGTFLSPVGANLNTITSSIPFRKRKKTKDEHKRGLERKRGR